jgi:hypothetical protein
MMKDNEKAKAIQEVVASSEGIELAAHSLISMVRKTEIIEGDKIASATLSLDVELTTGGTETWEITVARTKIKH